MTYNDIIRRIRYALDISDVAMVKIFKLSGHKFFRSEVLNLLKKEDEDGFIECSDALMADFLNGLIIQMRGRQEGKAEPPAATAGLLTNNAILKKLRIALALQEEDMLAIMQLADAPVSKAELSALFRKAGHKNYKDCGDQFLRNFLKGLTLRYRS